MKKGSRQCARSKLKRNMKENDLFPFAPIRGERSRIPNNLQRLAVLKSEIEALAERGMQDSERYERLKNQINNIEGKTPKYRPHVLKKYGL